MVSFTKIIEHFRTILGGMKTDFLAWYEDNSVDSQHEDYIDPEDFTDWNHIWDLADKVIDYYSLYKQWRKEKIPASKARIRTQLDTVTTEFEQIYGLAEDYMAEVKALIRSISRFKDMEDFSIGDLW